MKKTIISILCMPLFVHAAHNQQIMIRYAAPHDLSSLNALSEKQYQNDFKPLWEKCYKSLFPHVNVEEFIIEKTHLNNENNKKIVLDENPDKSSRLLVAEIKDVESLTNKIAGFCRFEKRDEKTMYMNFILVDEYFRKQGVAKKLASAAMNTFPDITTCRFRAHVHNKEINEIYLKHGCTQKGQVSIDLDSGKINADPNAPITHYDYEYSIKR